MNTPCYSMNTLPNSIFLSGRLFALLGLLALPGTINAQEVTEPEQPPVSEVTEPNTSEAAPTTSEAAPSPTPLSVAPLDHVDYTTAPPDWVDDAPQLDGDVAVWPVRSLLSDSESEARYSLEIQMRGALAAYAEYFLGDERARVLGNSPSLFVDLDSLPETDRYAGTAKLGGQTVFEQAARLRFDEKFRRRLANAWREREVEQRLSVVGIASGAGLLLLLAGTGLVRRVARKKQTPTL